MKTILIILILPFLVLISELNAQSDLNAQSGRVDLDLNGTWQFEQTENAFPPKKYTRKIQVPGLIHLAEPRIEEYDKFFKVPEESVPNEQHDVLELDYQPRYSWYRKVVDIPEDLSGMEAVIRILKSQYVTRVYVNGMDAGSSMACYTPVEMPVSRFIRFGQKNEILIRVGERIWLPSEAAGGTDKEKEHYLPGIWDDVLLSFTGKLRIHRVLLLPDAGNSKVTAKIQVRSFYPPQSFYGTSMLDSCEIGIEIFRKDNGKMVAYRKVTGEALRDNLTLYKSEFTIKKPELWSPENPFLYRARITVREKGETSDVFEDDFGLRDFEIVGKHFYLNGKKTYLRGSNITLQRFFEDPDCSDLVWDREWVTGLLGGISEQVHWNAMRICVGIVPDFWYDIADSCGLMLQNEWLYWQNHGWDEQIRKEYTDWVWSDGNHPSIVIWDAINENKHEYIGGVLIPELKQLDPTRVWDAGYMESDDVTYDDMDEPHPYMAAWDMAMAEDVEEYLRTTPYDLGKINQWAPRHAHIPGASQAQLVNEYGWIWLWRDGTPAKLTRNQYDYLLGVDASPLQRWEMQAYWLQLETEWLRAERSLAGVLAFCLLTNNYGYTGDYFKGNIRDLEQTLTLDWFRHCFAPVAVFIDLADQRYFTHARAYEPGSQFTFNLVGINDLEMPAEGRVVVELLDKNGNPVGGEEIDIQIPPYGSRYEPVTGTLPQDPGGYLVLAKLFLPGETEPVISRRYIRVGELDNYRFFDIKPGH